MSRARSKKRTSGGGDGARSARVVFGVGPVGELLSRRPDTIERILIRAAPRGRILELGERAAAAGLRVEEAEPNALEAAAGASANHQGVVAFAGAYPYAELEDLIEEARGRPIVVLDGVTDPHNLGAICRSAHLFDAAGVVIGRDRAAPVNAVATKASAGATEYLAIAQVTNVARALAEVREHNIWRAQIAATRDSRPLSEIDRTLPLALVMGSEGRGLRALVARETDFAFAIPMTADGVGSFNVSVAAAIALYELSR